MKLGGKVRSIPQSKIDLYASNAESSSARKVLVFAATMYCMVNVELPRDACILLHSVLAYKALWLLGYR